MFNNKTAPPIKVGRFYVVARGQGFEPQFLRPERNVLPLDDPRIINDVLPSSTSSFQRGGPLDDPRMKTANAAILSNISLWR